MQAQTAQQSSDDDTSARNLTQYLTFVLNDETYGIDILKIREIIDYGNITKVPMMPGYIAGVINLRGSVVPVVDLALRFSDNMSTKTKRSSIVIIEILDDEQQKMEIGVTVDVVNEVLDITTANIEPAPSFGTKIRTDFISGMGKVDNKMLVLLNTDNILAIEELSDLSSYHG